MLSAVLLACSDGSGVSTSRATPGGDGAGADPGSSAAGRADGGASATLPTTPPATCLDAGVGACAEPAPTWSCADSSYHGAQYWTCKAGSIYRCEGSDPVRVACASGCEVGPVGTDDECASTPPSTPPIPTFTITIQGGLFAESAVRAPIEKGLAYEIARIAKNVDVGTKTMPPFSLTFIPSSDSFASGLANVTHADIWVPPGYPLTGDNQNYVVNITLHEIGHLLANALIAPRELRDTCTNEGLASWIAGKYWMNAASAPVSSLRAAARYYIALGSVYASMSNCVSASDAWYKVYASFFEYLEQLVPGGIAAVSGGAAASTYASAWATWLAP
ncbi:MAG: hypothetical protein ABI551_24360 [Polyangiaceae bacterium]